MLSDFLAPAFHTTRACPLFFSPQRQHGNECFRKGKLGAAIDAYTEAVTLAPAWPVPLLNRALCHKRRADYASMLSDASRAAELDATSAKVFNPGFFVCFFFPPATGLQLARSRDDAIIIIIT